MEILSFSFSNEKERQIIKELLDSFIIIRVDLDIAVYVIQIRKKKKIKLPDAIIFASAKLMQCTFITRNTDDFINIDQEVQIVNPFLK